jgi:hypothetical protein
VARSSSTLHEAVTWVAWIVPPCARGSSDWVAAAWSAMASSRSSSPTLTVTLYVGGPGRRSGARRRGDADAGEPDLAWRRRSRRPVAAAPWPTRRPAGGWSCSRRRSRSWTYSAQVDRSCASGDVDELDAVPSSARTATRALVGSGRLHAGGADLSAVGEGDGSRTRWAAVGTGRGGGSTTMAVGSAPAEVCRCGPDAYSGRRRGRCASWWSSSGFRGCRVALTNRHKRTPAERPRLPAYRDPRPSA